MRDISSLEQGTHVRITLRRNIRHEMDADTGEKREVADVVTLHLRNREELLDDVKSNFDRYFEFGRKKIEADAGLVDRKNEVDRLVGAYELPEELSTIFYAMADSYESLYTETTNNSLAIADLYELIMTGGA